MSQGAFNEIGTENHGFKATTLAPVNQKIRVQQAGLTCRAMPVNSDYIPYCWKPRRS